MNDELELLKKRLRELYDKADRGAYFTFTDFLGLAEQSVLGELISGFRPPALTRYGGADGAERVMVRFGNPEEIGYDTPFPISCVKIEPLSQKFADKLTHRDFLGALMNLGIERRTLGDVIVRDNVGYVFADEEIAKFITGELKKVPLRRSLPTGRLSIHNENAPPDSHLSGGACGLCQQTVDSGSIASEEGE